MKQRRIHFLFCFLGPLAVVYALIGMEFYGGKLNNGCFAQCTDAWNQSYVAPTSVATPCDPAGKGRVCGEGEVCLDRHISPNDGVTNFDNAGTALLTVFVCITREGWTDVLYMVGEQNKNKKKRR
jgi:hypothetical protein